MAFLEHASHWQVKFQSPRSERDAPIMIGIHDHEFVLGRQQAPLIGRTNSLDGLMYVLKILESS